MSLVHPCPCCGYKTLPTRGGYDLCPVCWWEDDASEPWEYSGTNAQTLVEAQRHFLAGLPPHRGRPGERRASRTNEARDPDWQPFELTPELRQHVAQANEEHERYWEEYEYNAAARALAAEAPTLSYPELEERVADLARVHQLPYSRAHIELCARLLKDEDYYRGHALRTGWWMLRHARPGNWRQRWAEVRGGGIELAG